SSIENSSGTSIMSSNTRSPFFNSTEYSTSNFANFVNRGSVMPGQASEPFPIVEPVVKLRQSRVGLFYKFQFLPMCQEAGGKSLVKESADRLASFRPIIEGPMIDVHANEFVR